jgi:pyruvate dehydrogenase E2 component (dihydrolipoamide acetyltransferase)
MEEGTVVKWLVEEGAEVNPGNDVAEIETDKIANVVECNRAGVLRRKIAGEGDVLPIGALMGVIADPEISDAEIDSFIASYDGAEGNFQESGEAQETAPAAVDTDTPALQANSAVEPLTRMRAAIAKTVSNSWATIPHIFVTVKIDMGKAETQYRAFKAAGNKVSINDVVLRAVAKVAPAFPLVNASFADKALVLHKDVNIAVAVGLDQGVIMPVIHQCQLLSLRQIGAKSRELVERAQAGSLAQEELSGASLAVSNMGMLGVEAFTAIVPPALSAILAVGAIETVPVVSDGQIVTARRMRVTISADHRVLDGGYAAKFLAELKKTLEEPEPIFQ